MAFLLDTHTLLWAILDDDKLSSKARNFISDTSNECYFSIASLWEITIKHAQGSLDLKMSLTECFEVILKTGFTELPVKKEHLIILKDLQYHHRDPFDRILISQGIHEALTIITKDKFFSEYNVPTIW